MVTENFVHLVATQARREGELLGPGSIFGAMSESRKKLKCALF